MFMRNVFKFLVILMLIKSRKKYVPGHSFQGYPVVFKSKMSFYLKWNGKKILEQGWKRKYK